MIREKQYILGRKTKEIKCLSHHNHIKGTSCQYNLAQLMLTLITWLEVAFVMLFFFFPYCTFWKKVIMHSAHLRSGKSCSTSLMAEHLHKLWEFFCTGNLSILLHLSGHLQQYKLMDIYFISCVLSTSLFCCSNCSCFGHQELFDLAPISL